ncbi:hypothetical protein EVG20_g10237 [Dentipellis fragilis]|uniref:Uncharacterized protein n=1 Tax=Dentipellis fragilis TaxID=205917 RepID=A0A4Y9XS82_9AGAM|nr:hypothetical protein EVG20_g10237 [Dentipellis fragilis]
MHVVDSVAHKISALGELMYIDVTAHALADGPEAKQCPPLSPPLNVFVDCAADFLRSVIIFPIAARTGMMVGCHMSVVSKVGVYLMSI